MRRPAKTAEACTSDIRAHPRLPRLSTECKADLYALSELQFEPVSAEIAQLAGSFEDKTLGDPADRIIIATALNQDLTLLTPDRDIHQYPDVKLAW